MSIDLTQIIVALIGVVGTVATSLLVPKIITYIKTNTTEKQQTIITAVTKAAVYAAQQLFTNASDKKTYAIEYVDNLLSQYGIDLDATSISNAIEAALKQIKSEVGDGWNGTDNTIV